MTNEISKVMPQAHCHHPEREVIPLTDIYETEGAYVIKADMPGVPKENVAVTVDGGVLTVKGNTAEEKEGAGCCGFVACNFGRSFNLGEDVDANNIEAAMENGVLTLTLHKKAELKPKKIQITAH